MFDVPMTGSNPLRAGTKKPMWPVASAMNSPCEGSPSICFVGLQIYPVFVGDRSIKVVGGAEVQQSLLARAFVKRGYKVSLVSCNYGQDDGLEIDGVTIHRAHTPNEGVPILRFVYPRFTSIWQAMRRANADIYYARSSGAMTAFTVAFAKRHRRLSVYAAASDRDFLAKSSLPIWRDRVLYRWGLRHADLVVAQSETQREALAQNFGRGCGVVRSCYDHDGHTGRPEGVILWVGNIRPVKRPEMFIELVRRLPNYRFKMIGGADETLIAPLRRLAADLVNIEFAGFVPFAEIESHFDRASILVNTSSNEGFPNTFLQAWSRGIPTVSMIDPGAYLNSNRVGEVVNSVEQMAQTISKIKSNPTIWRALGQASRQYFSQHFSASQAVDSYEQCFRQALA